MSLAFPALLAASLLSFAQDWVRTDPYVFVPEDHKKALLRGRGRAHMILYGAIAQTGEFVPECRSYAGGIRPFPRDGSKGWPYYSSPGPVSTTFEFRSGRLIPGRITMLDGRHVFEPDLGGIITHFGDYRYSPWARQVYNLPGRFVYQPIRPGKKIAVTLPIPSLGLWAVATTCLPLPKTLVVPVTTRTREPAVQYEFVPLSKMPYYQVCGDKVWPGWLCQGGYFENMADPLPNTSACFGMSKASIPLLLLQGFQPLMRSPNGNPEVYEYRFGKLIPGYLEKGLFIPDLGGKVISFADHTYNPQGRCIYNLPGFFRPKSDKVGEGTPR